MPLAFNFYGTFLKPYILYTVRGAQRLLSSMTSRNYGQADLFQTYIIYKTSIFFYLTVVSIKGIYVQPPNILICIVIFNHLSPRYAFQNHLTSHKTDTHPFTVLYIHQLAKF